MTGDFKKRVQDILNKVAERDLKEISKLNGTHKKRTNTKPEKITEKACVEWMRNRGWHVQIIESKATYNPKGFWSNQSVKAGNADCQGTLPDGMACYIEFKAAGKLRTFANEKNQRQQQFMRDKIKMGAFAVVVDSVVLLEANFEVWDHKRKKDIDEAKAFLFAQLPK